MKNIKNTLLTFILVIVGAFLAVFAYSKLLDKPEVIRVTETQPVKYANLAEDSDVMLPDLTFAAESSVHAVVHIMTQMESNVYSGNNPLLDFFGYRYQQQEPQIARGYGSGVIISEDGYIVTNNHVIDEAQSINVVLNDKRQYEARLIGTDPETDIALLKIEEDNLSFMNYGNSDNLQLGEWVLAVGNPFNLTSTVTAGIVSAKARDININVIRNSDNIDSSIEAFIQTDAAVNPGNSGGALVNQQGQLVGINTAIAGGVSGTYTGYSFAIPSTIVKRVVDDLKEYGQVQRALLGVTINDIDANFAEENNIEKIEGVYISGVPTNGAAYDSGIEEGDIILSVNNKIVNSVAELQETVSQYRPGDEVAVIIKRNNEEKQFDVTLRNRNGDTEIVLSAEEVNTFLGAEFEEISNSEKRQLGIDYGLKITKIDEGKLEDAGLEKGFIITHVNQNPVYSLNDFRNILNNYTGNNYSRRGILIEGLNPNGEPAFYAFGIE